MKVLFSKDAFNWSTVTFKTFIIYIYNIKITIVNKCCSFKLLSKKTENIYNDLHKNIMLVSFIHLFYIDNNNNVSWGPNQHITMICLRIMWL